MKFAPAGLLALALAACDAGTTSPMAPIANPPVAPATAALRDALDRIAPTLGTGPAADALRSALAAAVEAATPAALTAVQATLPALEAELPDAAVEADVIRLALAAQR
jgi:hypothetical protein